MSKRLPEAISRLIEQKRDQIASCNKLIKTSEKWIKKYQTDAKQHQTELDQLLAYCHEQATQAR